MASPNLCDYCSQIDFEFLRNPTVQDLRDLNEGQEKSGRMPFTWHDSEQLYPCYCLGLASRIVGESSCHLCEMISKVFEQTGMYQAVHHDPVTIAFIAPCATFKSPLGTTWTSRGVRSLHGPVAAEDDDYFYLRRLGLSFRPRNKDELLKPGPMTDIKNNDEQRSTMLVECFQSCDRNPQSAEAGNLFEDNCLHPDAVAFGGRLRPTMIDSTLSARWLEECVSNHALACSPSPANEYSNHSSAIKVFRLIDVKREAVVTFRNVHLTEIRYAALSYVWGSAQKLTLRGCDVVRLGMPKSLRGQVSRTIEDAMHITALLNIQYLWVDALCIVQDSSLDKGVYIGSMSAIYEHSLLTIVAAAGIDADAGLPGLRMPRTSQQLHALVKNRSDMNPGMSLMTTLNQGRDVYDHFLDDSVWAARGWTLQERVMSRRNLIFTQEQIYWACRRSQWCEETHLETSLARSSWSSKDETEHILDPACINPQAPSDSVEQTWYQLRKLVLRYSTRKLTNDGDAHDAFAAILQEATKQTGEHFIWALPASRFELGLCWEPQWTGLSRREALSSLRMTSLQRHVSFPTWSWLGWKGPINLRVEDRYVDLGIEPEIICYVLRNSPLRLVRTSRVANDFPGPRSIFNPLMNTSSSPLAVSMDDLESYTSSWIHQQLQNIPDDQLLFFWTETAHFRLAGPLQRTVAQRTSKARGGSDSYQRQWYQIRDKTGNTIGSTAPCSQDNLSGDREFILIATNRPPESLPEKFVLQIEWRAGIAYRVNIAFILETSWIDAAPTKALIALG